MGHGKSWTGPAEGEGQGGLQSPHFFGNFKELLRKRCFHAPHFESQFSPPTFKVAPRALMENENYCIKSWVSLLLEREQNRNSADLRTVSWISLRLYY